MLAIERLQSILQNVNRQIEYDTKRELILRVVSESFKREGSDGFLNLLNVLAEVTDEVTSCNFRREDRRDRYLSDLRLLRDDLLQALVSERQEALCMWFYNAKLTLDVISASVTEVLDTEVYDLDRPAFVAHTQELIADISEWPSEDYAKRNLLLSMNLVCQQAQAEAVSSSDAELRRKIKSIVASFAIEFAEVDKEFETRWEKIKRWARLGYKGASTPLGLTADASEVMGLLPKP